MKGTRNSDWHFQGPVFLVSSPGQRRHPCECRWGQPHRRRPGFFPATQKTPPPWRDSDAMMKCFFSFLDVMRVLFVSFSPATWLKSSKKNTIVVYSWYIYGGDLCICGIPQPKSQSMAFFFFLRANGASSGFLKDVCQQFQDGAFGEFMDGWGCWGVRVFFGYAGTTTTTTADIWFQFQCFFPQFSQSLIMSNMYIIYVSPTYNVSIPLDPKTHEWKMKVLRPPKYGWNIQPPKNEGYGFPWYIIRLMAEILHHLGCIKPVNHGLNYLSTVQDFWTINSMYLLISFLLGVHPSVSEVAR